MTTEGNRRDLFPSLERGFAVLLAFDAERPNPTLAELASATKLSRPAVRRILLTLQHLGYVHRRGRTLVADAAGAQHRAARLVLSTA